jgi:preprotein translocase SecE subunit
MAIIKLDKSSLVTGQLNDSLKTSTPKDNLTAETNTKTNFLFSTIGELKKVKWPPFKYVISWSLMVICFTAVFSMILGASDHVFETSINFVNCTSPKGKARDLNTCTTEALQKLVGISNNS